MGEASIDTRHQLFNGLRLIPAGLYSHTNKGLLVLGIGINFIGHYLCLANAETLVNFRVAGKNPGLCWQRLYPRLYTHLSLQYPV